MKITLAIFCLTVIMALATTSSKTSKEKSKRKGNVLSMFQVVSFPNDVCIGAGTRNGTCYTSEECSSKAGVASGTCAASYGVCCVFAISCGQSSSENCTYIEQGSTTTLTSQDCMYEICPCNSNICRIRYDFTTFTLANPVQGTVAAAGDPAPVAVGETIGHCLEDSFTIASEGAIGSPTICGINTGYHMIIDAGCGCQTVSFKIGRNSGTNREWNIKVMQYGCGNDDVSGPPGCLQYYTATTGTIQSFNFPQPTVGTITETVTHLARQNYNVCIRRNVGACYICYVTTDGPTIALANNDQDSFGLSLADAAIAQSQQGTSCTEDYILIPNGSTVAEAMALGIVTAKANRFCGRYLHPTAAQAASVSVCSNRLPFRLGVVTGNAEADTAVTADMAQLNEQSVFPGGIIGFRLDYKQFSDC